MLAHKVNKGPNLITVLSMQFMKTTTSCYGVRNMLAENKVRAFLVDVLSRTADEKTACDKPGLTVRDDEKVSRTDFTRLICLEHLFCLYDQSMFKSLYIMLCVCTVILINFIFLFSQMVILMNCLLPTGVI